jgi:hypothetical protein
LVISEFENMSQGAPCAPSIWQLMLMPLALTCMA